MAITTITKVGAFSDDVAQQINDNFADLSGTSAGGALADGKILVGDAEGASAAVDMSGDATIVNTGAVTVVGANGAALASDGTEIDAAVTIIAAIPTVNQASPLIWNDGGVLKVGTA
jgi:hypothetical protein